MPPSEVRTVTPNPRSPPAPASDRVDPAAIRRAGATALLAGAWIVVGMVLVPHLIRGAYEGSSAAFLNHLITGQASHSLGEYLSRWRVLAWSSLGVTLGAGAFAVAAAFPERSRVLRLGLPVCAFVLARCVLWVGFGLAPSSGSGYRSDAAPARYATDFGAETWKRWDSSVYLSLADRGYEFYPCDVPGHAPLARTGLPSRPLRLADGTEVQRFDALRGHEWCGDTAWFPGYPALIRLLTLLRIPDVVAGVLLSAVFSVLTLVLLWTRLLGAPRTAAGFLTLLLAAFFPGAVYHHAIFPISMVTFFTVLAIVGAVEERWTTCGLAVAAAAFTYPPGALVAVALAVWVISSPGATPWTRRLGLAVGVGGMALAGVALVFAIQRWQVGIWDAFPRMQAAYGSGHHVLFAALPYDAGLVFDGLRRWRGIAGLSEVSPAAGALFVAFLVILLAVFSARRMRASPADAYLLVFLVLSWAFVVALGDMSLVRKNAVLLAATPLARNLPVSVLAPVVAFAILLTPFLAMVFFDGAMA